MGTTVFPKPLDNELDSKAPKASPTFTGSISLGRKANTQVGEGSFAVGDDVTASGRLSHAEGDETTASGWYSHAEGFRTTAKGSASHAEGSGSAAYNIDSHAGGRNSEAGGAESFVHGNNVSAYGYTAFAFGSWNVQDIPDWESGTSYAVNDVVVFNKSIYKCKTANSDEEFTISNWTSTDATKTYVEIVGNGTGANNRSNARVLDWDGNEHLKGNLYVGANDDGTGGLIVATNEGIEILANTDLNSLTTPGKYYSPNSTRTATLSNVPSEQTAGFTMTVKTRTSTYVDQEIQYLGTIYTRGSNSSGWSTWRKVIIDIDVENLFPTQYTGDLNNMGSGVYYCPSTATNLPRASAYTVECIDYSNGTYCTQVAYQNQSGDSVWYRRKRSGTWQSWHQLALDDRTRWFFTNTSTSGETKEAAIHAFLATIRSSMTSGEMANYAYYDGSKFYTGTLVKVSSKAFRGRMFKNDGTEGFYINDSSDNSTATITDFELVPQKDAALLLSAQINNTGSTADVITFGGGDSTWSSSNVGGIMYTHSNRQYIFRAKGSSNGKNEDYNLPVHSDGSSNASYDILTTKGYSSTLSKITVITGTSSNKTFSFTLTDGRHAFVAIAAGFVSFFNGNGTLYTTEMPSGFTAAISSNTVTITRNNTTTFVVHGIVLNT